MNGFTDLTPEFILAAVEEALTVRLTGMVNPLPSYINRVYELRGADGIKYIAKFYRPGRWSRETIADEHLFLADCAEAEIPVVPPLPLTDGTTVGKTAETLFCVFPKKAGRQFEINTDDDWTRIGMLLGRLHTVGKSRRADARITLHPEHSLWNDVEFLLDGGFIPPSHLDAFHDVAARIGRTIFPLFQDAGCIRVHGDFHRGNILDRLEEGVQIIDFDDMAMGPPVQDMWLLLPEYAKKSRVELDMMAEGYDRFASFNWSWMKLIEPLRAMRIVYFTAWCARQVGDVQFRKNFPDWGSGKFWQKEINDLEDQLHVIEDHLDAGGQC